MSQELRVIDQETMNGMSNEELLGLLRDATVNPECITYAVTVVQTRITEAQHAKEAAEKEAAIAKAAKNANGRTIKANNAGGLFVRDPSFKCWSEDKAKEYTGCINVDPDLFRALVNNEGLIEDIRAFLKTSGLTKFPASGKPAKTETPTDNGNTGAQVANSLVSTNPPLASRTRK